MAAPVDLIRFEVTASKDGKVILHQKDMSGWVTAKFVLIALGYTKEEAEELVKQMRTSLSG